MLKIKDFLTKNIKSCSSIETHETMSGWLNRLLENKQISFEDYQELSALNTKLLKDNFNYNIGVENDNFQTKSI